MTKRQAMKIVKNQIIRCRSRIGGPEDIITGGRKDYPPHRYLAALRRALQRESKKREPGAISRCAALYTLINLKRAGLA